MKKTVLMVAATAMLSWAAPIQAQQDNVTESQQFMQAGLQAFSNNQFPDAAKFFEAAYTGGIVDGAYFLGQMAELGLGTDQDMSTAIALYRAAAEGDSALALQRLGLLQFQGEGGLLQNFEEAHKKLCKAADLGLAQAMVNCAQLYQSGRGLEQNSEQAIEYYTRATELDYSPAYIEMARMYGEGAAVEKDDEKAHGLMATAAELGHVAALYYMAVATESGQFVEQDNAQAHMYYNLASARGHQEAKDALKRLSEAMSPEETKLAQKAAIAWTEKQSATVVKEAAEASQDDEMTEQK